MQPNLIQRLLVIITLFVVLAPAGLLAQRSLLLRDPLPQVASGFTPSCTASSNFIGRETSPANNSAMDTFICATPSTSGNSGLGAPNGLWAKMDVVYVFATNNTTNALLNLISGSFGATNHSGAFSANNGYTGTDASSTVWIDTGYNPSTNGTNYTLNSAHLSVWGMTNFQASASGGDALGGYDNTNIERLIVRSSGGTSASQINNGVSGPSFTDADSLGHRVGNRSGASLTQIYKNGASQMSGTDNATSIPNFNIFILARNGAGTAAAGSGVQFGIVTIGGSLSSTDVANLCHAENVYLTAVASISAGTC